MGKVKFLLAVVTLLAFTAMTSYSAAGLSVGGIIDTNVVPPPPLQLLDAQDDDTSTNEDMSVRIDVLSNDSYIGLGYPSVVSVTNPSHGTARINSDDTITYVPKPNFFGSDSFDYDVSDDLGLLSDTATVYVTINPVNDKPVANDDSVQTDEGKSVMINVLANDSDVDGDALSIISTTNGSGGTITVNSDNTVTYKPNSGFRGSDIFQYTITDGGKFSTATVSVTVNPVGGGSTTVALSVKSADMSGSGFGGQWVELWQNDNIIKEGYTPFSATIQTGSQYGIFIYDDPGENKFFNHWSDGSTNQKITITPSVDTSLTAFFKTGLAPNSPPTATNDSVVTNENNPVNINVIVNDTDPDGDPVTVVSTTQGGHGKVTINPNNSVRYQPNLNFDGADSFTYSISDGRGGTAIASVSITVNNVPHLIKVKSGLVAFDLLNNETKTRQQLEASQGYWHYDGSALNPQVFNPPAPTDLFKDSQGLHVGVKTPANGTYAGFFAVTPVTNATLFHAKIITPIRTLPSDFFQNGLYVQTWDGRINYVTCVSITGPAGTSWHIVKASGNTTQATKFDLLWSDPSANQPLSRDCTIITNGNNYLKVYIDGVKAYENNAIDLQMPGPFQYFLEPQNSQAQMLYGVYDDYYSTNSEIITVTNISPTATRVDVIDSSGNVLTTAPVSNGVSVLDVGMYHFPLVASIKVYGAGNAEIMSDNASIFGGDVYSAK